jgi:hypothetical protein
MENLALRLINSMTLNEISDEKLKEVEDRIAHYRKNASYNGVENFPEIKKITDRIGIKIPSDMSTANLKKSGLSTKKR